jgi:hypothetical protein
MNTIQINKILTKHVKYFQDVYPIDVLPSTLVKPAIIVINIDKRNIPGSHGIAEYFDSHGLPTYKPEIKAYLQRHSIPWTNKSHRLQDLTTNVLGLYCCIYALHRAKGLSMTSFVNMFLLALGICNDIRNERMFCAKFGECTFAASCSSSSSSSTLGSRR